MKVTRHARGQQDSFNHSFNLLGWTPYAMSRLLTKLLNIGIIPIGNMFKREFKK